MAALIRRHCALRLGLSGSWDSWHYGICSSNIRKDEAAKNIGAFIVGQSVVAAPRLVAASSLVDMPDVAPTMQSNEVTGLK